MCQIPLILSVLAFAMFAVSFPLLLGIMVVYPTMMLRLWMEKHGWNGIERAPPSH